VSNSLRLELCVSQYFYYTGSRAGHLRFTYPATSSPYVLIQATRPSVIGSADASNLTYPLGQISVDPTSREITGYNPERQDYIIGPNTEAAKGFKGYFCARFSHPFVEWGIAQNGTERAGEMSGEGAVLSAYAKFEQAVGEVEVRVGVSFISVDQARRNLENEIPDGASLEETARKTRADWSEKLDRIKIEGATEQNKTVFYTAIYHTLQV
jgi:putative alpha-1,2-mannosidase